MDRFRTGLALGLLRMYGSKQNTEPSMFKEVPFLNIFILTRLRFTTTISATLRNDLYRPLKFEGSRIPPGFLVPYHSPLHVLV